MKIKNNSVRVNILGCPIDKLTFNETISLIDQTILNKLQLHHTVVNAGKMVAMHHDAELRKSVVEADLINADGMAVVWASRLLRQPLPERVAGVDLMESLVKLAYEKEYKIFFFGAKEEIVVEVINKYSKMYSPSIIAGYRNGYYTKEEEGIIAEQIAASGANMLFVAISSPKKENFLYNYRGTLSKVNFTMGVGGSFDVVAGKVKRAPIWMQKICLEWFYRFAQEPKRMWRRYLVGNTEFIKLVTKAYYQRS